MKKPHDPHVSMARKDIMVKLKHNDSPLQPHTPSLFLPMMRSTAFLISAALWALSSVAAEEAGTVKSVKGLAHIERANLRIDVTVGTRLHAQDRLVSGPASSVGITLNDSTLLTAGPNSTIELSQYTFDPSTRVGHMDTTVKRGTLSVVSGQMAKHKPEQVVFRTNTVTLGVRGTEFIIDVDAQIDVQK